MKKNQNKQIIPLAILLLFLTASYSFASSGGLEEGTFLSTTSNTGIASLRSLEEATEYDIDLCSLSSVDCNFEQVNTYTAWTTKYSRADSCHNRKGDKCLTAIGQDTQAGITVACPRRLKLGTRVKILGHIYTCHDRYAQWVQNRQGDTYDIFTENYNEAVKFGKQKLTVEIL